MVRFCPQLGSKPKSKPKREKTEEEKTFKRRAKYFLAAQLLAVLLFLSVMGGYDSGDLELDDEDEGISFNWNKSLSYRLLITDIFPIISDNVSDLLRLNY